MEMLPVIKVFTLTTVSFVIALAATPFLTRFLYRYKLGKQIRDEQSAPIVSKLHAHKSGTPTMGGMLVWGTTLALALGGMLSEGWNFLTRRETLLPLGALVASGLVGLVDDYWNVRRIGPRGGGMRMRLRLALYTAISVFGAWWFFFKLERSVIHVTFFGDINLGWLYIPVFIFIIVATSFSVNETDGLDGLAGGTLLSAFAAYGAIAFAQGRFNLATFCGVIAGALLAFLWNNIHPAKFFMGDTGAMALGVTLGVVAMLTDQVMLLPIIGSVFVVESGSVILQICSKKFRGKKIFKSSPIHHHLEASGWPEPTIVMRFWVIAGVSAVIGVILGLADASR